MATKKTVWDLNPNMKECFETADGTKFFKKENAKTHARNLDDKTVKPLTRPGTSNKLSGEDKLTAPERIEVIKLLETVKAVEDALVGEKATTVIAAGEARITELKAAK